MGRAMVAGFLTGLVLLSAGGVTFAQEASQSASADKSDGPARLAIAYKLINARQYDEAVAVCKEPAVGALGIESQQCIVSAYILAGRDAEADAEWQRMLSDYSGDPCLVDAIVAVAERHWTKKNVTAAKGLFLLAAARGSGTDAGAKAWAGLAKWAIEADDRVTVAQYVAMLMQNYSGKDILAHAISSIANEYERRGMRSESTELLEDVAKELSGMMRLKVMSGAICTYIEDGDDKAEDKIEEMKQEAESNPEAALCLMPIANTYLEMKDFTAAAEMFRWVREEYGTDTGSASTVSKLAFYSDLCDMLVGLGNESADALAGVGRFCSDYAARPEMPDAVWQLARRCYKTGRAGKNEAFLAEARELFGWFGTRYPTNRRASSAGLMRAQLDVFSLIDKDDIDSADTSLAKMKADFAGNDGLVAALADVAERYGERGEEVAEEVPDPDNKFCKKSILVYQNEVIPASTDRNETSAAYHMIGLNYEILGDYEKSASFRILAVDSNPEYESAWQCLYGASTCYDNLAKYKGMPRNQADCAIRGLYQQIIDRYSNCPERITRSIVTWLDYHD